MREEPYSVSELTLLIKDLIETEFLSVSVRGEISSLSWSRKGHCYFVLKDRGAQLKAVLFKGRTRFFRELLRDGVEVVCTGPINVYPSWGEYQLVVEHMEEVGLGALFLELERLKRRLEAEGLFDEKLKKSIPPLPRRVGIVTSPTGAAVRDILRIIRERSCSYHIFIYPCHVQGREAAPEIVEGIRFFNSGLKVDVIVVARGGGSVEDLWAFNEEIVARAIFESSVPVISAVGHEKDYTLADLVADMRCATPTHAGHVLAQREEAQRERLLELKDSICRFMEAMLEGLSRELSSLKKRLELRDPKRRLYDARLRLDELSGRMERAVSNRLVASGRELVSLKHRLLSCSPGGRIDLYRERLFSLRARLKAAYEAVLERKRLELDSLSSSLRALSPRRVLSRGYAICYANGKVVKSHKDVEVGQSVLVELFEGAMECRVKKKMPLLSNC